MKEKPILFSAPMVRALLDGSKTQTRRVMTDLIAFDGSGNPLRVMNGMPAEYPCPYGKVGDQLWVKETFIDLLGTGIEGNTPHNKRFAYAEASPKGSYGDDRRKDFGLKWKPSIFMPRIASRIQLEIINIRFERLNDINEADAIAEGIKLILDLPHDGPNFYTVQTNSCNLSAPTAKDVYKMLWEWINGENSWVKNPWVWVVEFKVVKP